MTVHAKTSSLDAMQCNLAGQAMASQVIARVVRERLAKIEPPLCPDARAFAGDLLAEIDAYGEAALAQLKYFGR